jgi:hypothetical protein
MVPARSELRDALDGSFGDRPGVAVAAGVGFGFHHVIGAWLGSLSP